MIKTRVNYKPNIDRNINDKMEGDLKTYQLRQVNIAVITMFTTRAALYCLLKSIEKLIKKLT